ncbi:hypothetical protein MBT84_19470 [Streptomyces sp. MBT84]|nr:hypothetical protein [Streptomyces sp. MBT84]
MVVAGVSEKDRGGAVALGRGVEGGVARVPGGCFGAAVAAHAHGDGLDRGQSELAHAQGDFLRAQVGAGLQTVVDRDAAGADAEFGRLEGQGGGERHGIGATRARHEHERRERTLVDPSPGVLGGRLGEDVVEDAAHRQAYRRDRRMGTHVRFPSEVFGGCTRSRSLRVCKW